MPVLFSLISSELNFCLSILVYIYNLWAGVRNLLLAASVAFPVVLMSLTPYSQTASRRYLAEGISILAFIFLQCPGSR